jgi:hypothetical protein
MRTKTLLLTAALSAAGVATSMAQVYSVNAVGYVNTTLTPGFNLISNPLDAGAGNNTIQALFDEAGAAAPGMQVYKFVNGTYVIALYDDLAEPPSFQPPAAAATTVEPGEGVFVRNPLTTPLTVTFVGEVKQGDLSTPIPPGLSILSSQVPQAGTASELGLQGTPGDQVMQFGPTGYYISLFDDLEDPPTWVPALKPLKVGEAFFFRSASTTARAWTRTFSVNQ